MQRTYNELIGNISSCLNSDYRSKEDKELFMQCLRELKEKYTIEISTKFLKGFLIKDLQGRSKTFYISNFLRSMGLKTKRKTRAFSNWNNQKSSIDLIDYAIGKNGKVFIKECVPKEIGKFVKEFGQEVLYFIKL